MSKHASVSSGFIIFTVLFLTACSTGGSYSQRQAIIPEGSKLEVSQPLRTSFGMATAYIQQGDVVRWSDVKRFSPYCYFKTTPTSGSDSRKHRIQPTQFEIGKTRSRVYALKRQTESVQIASTDWTPLAMTSGNHSPGLPYPFIFTTTISIHSDDEPQVTHLNCAYWGEATNRALNIDQIKNTLGELVRFL